MKKYYRERFKVQRRLIKKTSALVEVNEIIETVREELRTIIPNCMEVCILLLDPDADQYTRPLQCALYEKPVSCQSCKRDRPAIQKAIHRKKAVVVSKSEPVRRPDNTLVAVGPEYAIPVFVKEKVVAVVSVVIQPLTRYGRRDFFLIQDFSDILGSIILAAKQHWQTTREKIRISQALAHLSPFVPESVRHIVKTNPKLLDQAKQRKHVTVLFLDLEDYTRLSAEYPDDQVNEIIEKMFSSFVDPIHRSHGDINETSGDALMIIFKDHDAKTNAINAVKAAFEIVERNRTINRSIQTDIDPIEVNIGINSGEALVGMTRFKGALDTRMTFTASGHVTNLAARLSDRAQGGDILIGEETRKMVKDIWPVYDLGPGTLKGVKHPVRIYSLLHNAIPKSAKD